MARWTTVLVVDVLHSLIGIVTMPRLIGPPPNRPYSVIKRRRYMVPIALGGVLLFVSACQTRVFVGTTAPAVGSGTEIEFRLSRMARQIQIVNLPHGTNRPERVSVFLTNLGKHRFEAGSQSLSPIPPSSEVGVFYAEDRDIRDPICIQVGMWGKSAPVRLRIRIQPDSSLGTNRVYVRKSSPPL